MNLDAFFSRFKDHMEIGRDIHDPDVLQVFYDDGNGIGVYRESRRTTMPLDCEILYGEKADEARAWYAAERRKATALPRDVRIRRALELAERIMDRDGIQALKGEAWTDNELTVIKDGRAALDEGRGR